MLETSARLLRLLSLFQARRYWSGAELVERLKVTSRTLRRDVDRLRHLGYPVHSTSGTSGGYQLGAGATLPPLLLDDEEAVAVAVGLRTSASGSVTGIEESARSRLSLDVLRGLRDLSFSPAAHGGDGHGQPGDLSIPGPARSARAVKVSCGSSSSGDPKRLSTTWRAL